jgi:hypothetical protein
MMTMGIIEAVLGKIENRWTNTFRNEFENMTMISRAF